MTMRPTIGEMRHRFTLEAPTRVPDDAGGFHETWSAVAEFWGQLASSGGNETYSSDRRSGRVTHSIMTRARPDLAPSMRLRLGTRIFEIRTITLAEERRRRIRIYCEERDL